MHIAIKLRQVIMRPNVPISEHGFTVNPSYFPECSRSWVNNTNWNFESNVGSLRKTKCSKFIFIFKWNTSCSKSVKVKSWNWLIKLDFRVFLTGAVMCTHIRDRQSYVPDQQLVNNQSRHSEPPKALLSVLSSKLNLASLQTLQLSTCDNQL